MDIKIEISKYIVTQHDIKSTYGVYIVDKSVFLIELPENKGRSVTNSIEVLIPKLAKKFSIDNILDYRWFEVYYVNDTISFDKILITNHDTMDFGWIRILTVGYNTYNMAFKDMTKFIDDNINNLNDEYDGKTFLEKICDGFKRFFDYIKSIKK